MRGRDVGCCPGGDFATLCSRVPIPDVPVRTQIKAGVITEVLDTFEGGISCEPILFLCLFTFSTEWVRLDYQMKN
jgi:hypothetical protein